MDHRAWLRAGLGQGGGQEHPNFLGHPPAKGALPGHASTVANRAGGDEAVNAAPKIASGMFYIQWYVVRTGQPHNVCHAERSCAPRAAARTQKMQGSAHIGELQRWALLGCHRERPIAAHAQEHVLRAEPSAQSCGWHAAHAEHARQSHQESRAADAGIPGIAMPDTRGQPARDAARSHRDTGMQHTGGPTGCFA